MADFTGSSGNDIYTGGLDADTATGRAGNDRLNGGGGNDVLAGNAGADTLDGGTGEDWLFSGDQSPAFNLPYYGSDWTAPLLDTGSTPDTLRGGEHTDHLFAGYGDDVDGGANGASGDYLFISFLGAPSGVTVDFGLATQTVGGGTITGIENVSWIQGSNYADEINSRSNSYGYSEFTAVFGMGGNDRLLAGYYTGTLFGGDGNDIVDGRGSQYLQEVDGGPGADTLYTSSNTFGQADGGPGNDTIYSHGTTYGGTGDDLVILQPTYYLGWVYGQEGDDEIRASASGSSQAGGPGADILTGSSGQDTLYSADLVEGTATPTEDRGRERDTLSGGGGDDTMAAGYGDHVDGGTGSDSLILSLRGATAGVTLDTTAIAAGTPFVLGGGTIQNVELLTSLLGSDFADMLKIATHSQQVAVDAGGGDDVILSRNSSVSVLGGDGDDRFVSGAAGDRFDGGAGIDTVDYANAAAGVTVTLAADGASGSGAGGDKLFHVENVDGSTRADTLNGNGGANVLNGMAGGDTLSGNGGNDLLDGGAGADTMRGGAGDDIFVVDNSLDQVRESSGNGTDRVNAGADYRLAAGEHVEILATTDRLGTSPLHLAGNERSNSLYGNAGANRLEGAAGNDLLDGGAGLDRLEGGTGDDRYVVDASGDVIVELAGEGTDSVESHASYTLADHVEQLTLTGGGDINGAGNGQANTITGNDGNNRLNGKAGVDFLIGGKGHDTYVVDNVADQLVEGGSSGTDTVESSVSYGLPTHFEKLVLTGSFAIDGRGNNGANVIVGNARGNFLNGGGGDDTINGGAGDDWLMGGAGNDQLRGGTGGDRFYFNLAPGAANVDALLDFSPAADSLYLLRSVFTRAGANGALNPAAFHQGSAAADAGDRIVYDQATGKIFYDADGAGAAAAMLFATVTPGTALSHGDFIIYG